MLASPGLRSRPAERRSPHFALPCLESLEGRLSPTAMTATLSLNVSYGLGRNVTLSGDLTATPNPGNQLITIQGMVNGQVVTDAEGRYSLSANANYLGVVSAQKADGSSSVATTAITDAAPIVSVFNAIEGAEGMWSLQGTVSYHRPFEALTVNFGGTAVSINGRTTEASSNGVFTLSVQLNGTVSDNGTIWAEAISPWGLVSSRMYETIHQTGT